MTRQVDSPSQHITANNIGNIAHEVLATGGDSSVLGVTSRGIFLKTSSKWVIFLSFEKYRSPLTVNLTGKTSTLRVLTQGELIQTAPESIFAPKHDLEISLTDAHTWIAQSPTNQAIPRDQRLQKMTEFAQAAYANKAGQGLSDLIPTCIDSPTTNPPPIQQDYLRKLRQQLQDRNIPAFVQSLSNRLGLGDGLTPSWDDFTTGLLLVLNRWGHIIQPQFEIEKLNQEIIQNAYAKTTTISANLIECASMGLGDERLIATTDYIFTGQGNEDTILQGLLSWGNSSGVDALVGMLVVIIANNGV